MPIFRAWNHDRFSALSFKERAEEASAHSDGAAKRMRGSGALRGAASGEASEDRYAEAKIEACSEKLASQSGGRERNVERRGERRKQALIDVGQRRE